MYSLIVFDWDGTLIDSAERIVSCMQSAIAEVGLSDREDSQVKDIIGLGLAEAIRQLYPDIEVDALESLKEKYSQHFIQAEVTPSPLFPGVETLLSGLRDEGYQLAVATGKSRRGLNRVFGTTKLGDYFHASRCADETQSKPHPQMLLELMGELGAEPNNTLMIGDTEFDMGMAQRAGVDRVAVSYGVHSMDRLSCYNPVLTIDNAAELADWLQTIHKDEIKGQQ